MKIYRFRNILLNTFEHSIWRKGEIVFLPAKGYEILRMLIEHDGRAVSKDEFLGSIWEGAVVEEGNLAVHVWKLRKILACARSERVIETVHGYGYRLACKVEEVDETLWIQRTNSTLRHGRDTDNESLTPPILRSIKIHNQSVRLRIHIENEPIEVGVERERERERERAFNRRLKPAAIHFRFMPETHLRRSFDSVLS